MKLHFVSLPDELREGLRILSPALGIEHDDEGLEVTARCAGAGLHITVSKSGAVIEYSRRVEFFRALGLICEKGEESGYEITEKPVFDSAGAFFDNSRNAVMLPSTIKEWIRISALMGFDALYLYTEDTYEVPGLPGFGHMRGRFTAEEIRGCDSYAKLFGIELIPCIQTLAHLNGLMRWPEFRQVRDCGDILLIGDERTYELIDSMLSAARDMYSTDKINIGMDEAEMTGLGEYLKRNGYSDRFDIMIKHLERVAALCEKHGFRPMMWSDMFFKLLFSSYYSCGRTLTGPDVEKIKNIPENTALVYWNYYSTDRADYDRDIESHRQFGREVVFAGGAWKWTGFAPGNRYSLDAGRAALASCLSGGIKRVMVTCWGDDGAECSSFAVLPAVQLYAEACYAQDTSDSALARRLRTCAGAEFSEFMDLDLPDLVPGSDRGKCPEGISKCLLYQDILCGLYDSLVGPDFHEYYSRAAAAARRCAEGQTRWAPLFETSTCLCETLELKCDMGLRLRRAYLAQDRQTLENIAASELPELLNRVEKLHQAFRGQWMSENKPFGFDVQDIRFGGLKERIRSAKRVLDDYLAGNSRSIPELEEELLPGECVNNWKTIASANVI